MLTPKFLQRITEATEKKTAQLNAYLTRKIVDRILHVYEKTGEVNVNTAAVFDALKKQESGKLFDEIVEEIVRYMPTIEEEVREAFYDSAGKISRDMCLFTEKVLKIEQDKGELLDIDIEELPKVSDWEQIGIPRSAKDLNLTPKEIRLLEAAYKRTNGEIHNITQTTALATEQTFIDACDAAWWKATHGVSPDVAIMEAIEEVAAKGIITVHYANREEKIEVAIARAVKTGVNQANGDITLTRCAEMGVGYVLVNEHIGARVTKYEDYTNHAHWQGKVYKLDWSNPVLAKYQPTQEEIKENKKSFGFLDKIRQFLTRKPVEEYEDFITVCGYGKMLGICGINCRHSFNPFYPDININTNQGIDKQENEERYRNEQKQRAMERNIRDMKRRELALKHAEGQTENEEITKRRTELQERIQEKREQYIEFCKDKKLTRESYRLQIAKKYGVSNGEDDMAEHVWEELQKMNDDEQARVDARKAAWKARQKQTEQDSSSKVYNIPNFDEMQHADIVKWADSNLKTTFEDIKGVNKEYYRETVKALAEFETKMGGKTIEGLSIKYGGNIGSNYAKYDDKTKTLLLKKTGTLQSFEEAMKHENARYKIKWHTDKDYHATTSYKGTIYHELGHAVDTETGQALSRKLSNDADLFESSTRISAYAGSSQGVRVTPRSEAWAENFAAYMEGGSKAKEVQKKSNI